MSIKAHFVNIPPAGIREISLTSPLSIAGIGELSTTDDMPDYVTIKKGNTPLLTLRINYLTYSSTFKEVDIFGDYVAIGDGDRFYLFDMANESCMTLRLNGYFCHLYVDGDELFVCSAADIICIDRGGAIRWVADDIAVDGVFIYNFERDIIKVSAEIDPPGGWVDLSVSRIDGSVMERVGE